MKKKARFVWLVLILVLLIAAAVFFFTRQESRAVGKEELSASAQMLQEVFADMTNLPQGRYEAYLAGVPGVYYQGEDLRFAPEGGSVHLSEIDDLRAEVTVTAPQDGLYAAAFTYTPQGENVLSTVVSARVDGQTPYDEWTSLQANNVWQSEGFPLDRYGNECVSMPLRNNEDSLRSYFRAVTGRYSQPMLVYLTQGEHVFSMGCEESAILLEAVWLCAAPQIGEEQAAQAPGDALILIEAEGMDRRNNPNVRTAAAYNTALTPYSSGKRMQNYLEDTSFRYGGSLVEYDFEVEAEGYYNMAFVYRQGDKDGFTTFRNVYIDGKIPSWDFADVPFGFTRSFAQYDVDGRVYLTAGKHTLGLEVSLDPVRPALEILEQVTSEMNDLTLEITKITGGNTDRYRDFHLLEYGIDAESALLYWADLLERTHAGLDQLKSVQGKCGETEQIRTAATLMRNLAKKPNELPKRLNEFTRGMTASKDGAVSGGNNVSCMQYLINTTEYLQFSELGLDKILLYQDEAELPRPMSGLTAFGSDMTRFFNSFGEQEYTPAYDGQEGEALQVWINRPRQYLEIIQNLIDTRFTPMTGIKVDLSIVPDQNKLILANASGKAPDVAVAVATGNVYDLAVRGALWNMRDFENFNEVASRFSPGMLIPGVLDEGVYAIPETFNFQVMFYRSDILEALNLEPPDTMQDVVDMLPALRRMGMNFNYPVSNHVVKPFSATTPIIYQFGGHIYQDGTAMSSLDSQATLDAITMMTDFYNVYNMQYYIANFYQYFRDGRTPVGISDYGTFNLLTNAAPELSGKWELALYPGIPDEHGEVQRWSSGAAESNIIFSSTDRAEEAWAFLDWYMSTETQSDFAFMLQTTLGNEYMWNSANLEAMASAPWNRKHKAVILEQLQWVAETPRVPGGYMAEREISNALNEIVAGKKLQTTIDAAVRNIDREVRRKLEEFGYTKDGEYVKPFVLPTNDMVEGWLE